MRGLFQMRFFKTLGRPPGWPLDTARPLRSNLGLQHFLLLLILPTLFLPSVLFGNELVLKSGERVQADHLELKGDEVVIRTKVGGGSAQVPYPLSRIEKLVFSLTEKQARLLGSADPKDLGDLKAFWLERKPFLEIPESDAGAVGLHYARTLIAAQDPKLAEEALAVIAEIRERDWKVSRQQTATRVRIAGLAAAGRIEEAMAEADAMQDLGAGDDGQLAETRIRSKFIQADLAWNQCQELEEDWPKWHLMPEKREERRQLINQALDAYLFPVVAHTEQVALCAEGLVQAARIYLHQNQTDRARICVEEVMNYFPEPAFVGQAREIQRKLNQQGNSS